MAGDCGKTWKSRKEIREDKNRVKRSDKHSEKNELKKTIDEEVRDWRERK